MKLRPTKLKSVTGRIRRRTIRQRQKDTMKSRIGLGLKKKRSKRSGRSK